MSTKKCVFLEFSQKCDIFATLRLTHGKVGHSDRDGLIPPIFASEEPMVLLRSLELTLGDKKLNSLDNFNRPSEN